MRTILLMLMLAAAATVPATTVADEGNEAGLVVCDSSGSCVDACLDLPRLPALPDPVGGPVAFRLCKVVVVGV